MAASRSDLLLIKLNRGGILPEAEFAGINNTKRVRAFGLTAAAFFRMPRGLCDEMIHNAHSQTRTNSSSRKGVCREEA